MATVREVVSGHAEAGTLTLNTSAAPQVGDLLLLLHHNDFYELSNLQEPGGGGAGGWTLHATADRGTNAAHGKTWASEVTSAGQQTVELRQGEDSGGGGGSDDACMYGWLFVFAGGQVEDAAGATGTSTDHAAPSVDLAASAGRLVCGWGNDGGAADYTVPGSMSGQTEIDCSSFSTSVAADEALDVSGATGTRTATSSLSRGFAALSVAVADSAVISVGAAGYAGAYGAAAAGKDAAVAGQAHTGAAAVAQAGAVRRGRAVAAAAGMGAAAAVKIAAGRGVGYGGAHSRAATTTVSPGRAAGYLGTYGAHRPATTTVPGTHTPGAIRPTLTPKSTRPTLTHGSTQPRLTAGRSP